jgi:branched-chain amino acid aminotransferase
MEVLSIVEADRRIIGTGMQGEVCRKLKSLFFEITIGKNPKYTNYCTPIY